MKKIIFFLSKTGNFWIGLLEFSKIILNKGKKVNQLAFMALKTV